MPEQESAQTSTTPETSTVSAPSGDTPTAELSDQDSYLDAIGMNDDEEEFDPENIIAPKGESEASDESSETTEVSETSDELEAAAAPAEKPDPFMEWVSRHTPEQIESLLRATAGQPQQTAKAEAQPESEPELPIAELIKPLASHLQNLTGEDATPQVEAYTKALLQQVGKVYKAQIAQRDQQVKSLTDQIDRVTAHIERQEVTAVLKPLEKTYPDMKKPGMRDQVEAKMRALAKTDEYSNLEELARDAALLTFGRKAVAAQVDAKARAAAAARAGQLTQPNQQVKKPTKASFDVMRSRIAELAASGAGAKRIQQVKQELGW